jgi:translation initiation factor IF-1
LKDESKGIIETEGIVIEKLPNAVFRIRLSNDKEIMGHISGKMRMHFIKLVVGDRVRLEISKYDLTKGRITYRI